MVGILILVILLPVIIGAVIVMLFLGVWYWNYVLAALLWGAAFIAYGTMGAILWWPVVLFMAGCVSFVARKG